jgi:outer membrane protein OmpA-like peptidoglycan-associated protein
MKSFILLTVGAATLATSIPALAEDAPPATRPGVAPGSEFPALKEATRPQGVFVPARHLALVAPGLKKSEIYTLLDVPHFHEGLFGVHRWNYIINFYTGQGDEYRQCQYQVRFGRRYRVESSWWKDAECAQLFERGLAGQAVEAAAPAPVAVAAPAVEERASKSYSFNFAFNSAVVNGDGREVIAQVTSEAGRAQYRRIVVTGFTDTVGSRDYNDALAARRAAATVTELSDALARIGSPLATSVFSRGGRDLAVATPDDVREVRNRRVLIEFF